MGLSTASKLEWGALLIALPVLFVTNPTEADAEKRIRDEIVTAINESTVQGKDFLSGIANLGCKIDIESCYRIHRSTINHKYQSFILFSDSRLSSSNGFKQTCIGIINRFYCPSFLN